MLRKIAALLPGSLALGRGNARDYAELERFHYLPRRPATWADVRTITYAAPGGPWRLISVGVLSYPALSCAARERLFGIATWPAAERARFVNASLRTISRIIVHPQFRGLGLGAALVRCLCDVCPTRYVEALALMGAVHPLFLRGGMRQVGRGTEAKPAYYILDRAAASRPRQHASASNLFTRRGANHAIQAPKIG